ncbi:MAG: hypothetical protein ACYSOK_06415 [Planctomycetota bacterium]|jgi:hypothetical protein
MKALRWGLVCAGIFLWTGCRVIQPKAQTPYGHYYLDDQGNFNSVDRVVLLELENQSARVELPEQLTQAMADSLGKKHLFSIHTINRMDPYWSRLNLDEIEASSPEDLASIGQELNVDAVVFGTIKRYRSYPHLLMALHLKMLDVRTGRLLWAMEQVWDSTDRQVELRMKEYYKKEVRQGYQPLDWKIMVTSPRAFNKFVVYEIGQTLPHLMPLDHSLAMPEQKQQPPVRLELFQN